MCICSALQLDGAQKASDAPLYSATLWSQHSCNSAKTCLQKFRHAGQVCSLPSCKSNSRSTSSSRLISGCWREVVSLCEYRDKL